MYKKFMRNNSRLDRTRRIRAKVSGTANRPRLAVFLSLAHISVQLIDDVAGQTLVSVSDYKLTGKPVERATAVGEAIAKAAAAKKIDTVVFDRGGYKYHGQVAALAAAARTAGLNF